MKRILPGVLFTVVAVLFFTSAFAQPYRTLTINDFQGTPRSNGGEIIAYTNCTIGYRYDGRLEKNYYVLNFTIDLKMNRDQSWVDRARITSPDMLAEILRHEQGHYTIAYMEQQELLRTVSRTVFYSDYQSKAAEIFSRIDAKYKQLNHDYDEDTNHMVNRQQQRSWDAYFKKRLEFMPPVQD